MNKLRSDSVFCQLTPEQADTLEEWLFEDRLSYPKVTEKLKAEFGLETSLTGVRRFYKRLDVERSAQSLADATEMSGMTVQALKSGELKPAMLLYANKCLFDLLRQEPVPIKEVTTLLRAITSAEARAFRQAVDDREQAELRERERVRKVEAEWREIGREIAREDEELERKRAARKKAKLAAEKAVKGKENIGIAERKVEDGTAVNLSTPLPGEGRAGHSTLAFERLDVPSSATGGPESKNRAGDENGVPTSGSTLGNTGSTWQPSVVEEEEYAENYTAEAAENRVTPRNAA